MHVHQLHSRVLIRRVVVVVSCLLAPLCAHTGPAAARAGGGKHYPAASSADISPLTTIHVGRNPVLVAIDARDRRAFVADEGPLSGESQALPAGPGSVDTVDERTGAVLRRVAVGQSPIALGYDAPTGRVFVLCAGRIDTSAGLTAPGGSVSVLDAATGALVRTLRVGAPTLPPQSLAGAAPGARQSLVVDSTSGRVYVVVDAGVLVLDGRTGAVRGELDVSGSPVPTVGAIGGRPRRLFVGDGTAAGLPTITPLGYTGGLLAILDARTGRGVANVVLRQPGVCGLAVDERAGRVLAVELPGDRAYSAIADVVDARTGALVRRTDLGLPGDGNCAVGVDRTTARAFILYTPSPYEFQDGAGGRVVVVLDTRSGKLFGTAPLPTTTSQGGFLSRTLAIDEHNGRVLVAAPQGGTLGRTAPEDTGVQVLDARSGRLLRRLRVGGGPQDVAIDGATHRVFVTDAHADTLDVFDAARL